MQDGSYFLSMYEHITKQVLPTFCTKEELLKQKILAGTFRERAYLLQCIVTT